MGHALTEYSKPLGMVQMHEHLAKGINEVINVGDTLPETHHTSMPPIIHSVNQGLKVKAGNGNFDARGTPKVIGPRMIATMMTSPTSQTSTGIEEEEVETVTTDGTRVKQSPNNEKPTGGETEVKMTLDRMKGATAMIRHKGLSKRDHRHFHTATETPLATSEKYDKIGVLEEATRKE